MPGFPSAFIWFAPLLFIGSLAVTSPSSAQPQKPLALFDGASLEGWWGSLYDESRRNRLLARADAEIIERVLKPNTWNHYTIHAEGRRVRLAINDEQTVDYTESDESLEQTGKICVQIHSGPPGEAWYKDITLERR